MYKYEFMTLTQLGQLFGVSSHQLGRWLVDIGLRNEKKRPSQKAFDGDYCKAGPSRGDGYNWIWHTEKTVEALSQAGHRMVSPPPLDLVEPPTLKGPFTQRPRSDGITDVVGGDGRAAVWCSGDDNAVVVVRLLNYAHERGVIERLLGKKAVAAGE